MISKDDPHWWQAYRLVILIIFLIFPIILITNTMMTMVGRDGEWTQTLAGLIPSLALQQHRLALQRQKREQVLIVIGIVISVVIILIIANIIFIIIKGIIMKRICIICWAKGGARAAAKSSEESQHRIVAVRSQDKQEEEVNAKG